MKKSLALLSAVLMIASFNSFAKTECRDEYTNPSLTCMNPDGGADVRLHITEFQTCKDGNIAELDRSILGLNVVSQRSVDDIHTINEENISIEYSAERTLIDAENRVDSLSFLMPKTATIVDGNNVIEMIITNKTAPDYDGSQNSHYKGSFKLTKANGKIVKGKLVCFVNR